MAAHVGLDRPGVIQAAAEIADAEGLDALTLARLADRLGVRYQSLYSHVSGPAELHRELHLLYLHQLRDVTRSAAVGLTGRDALVAIAVAQTEFDLAHPGLNAVHWKLGAKDPSTREAILESASAVGEVLSSYGLQGEELEHWRRAFASSVFGFSSLQIAGLLYLDADPRKTVVLVIETLADGIERLARDRATGTGTARASARRPRPARAASRTGG